MTVAIHQPDYIPWLGFYYKVAHSDRFVYLDDAQYSTQADHNVNVIKTPQGVCRLKIPVEQHMGDLICDVRTKDELKWKEKHLKTIEMNYKKAMYFKDIFESYCSVINQYYSNISELNMAINQYIMNGFGINTPVFKSSEINICTYNEERVIDICLLMGADEYLSGNGARAYQTGEHFSKKGLTLTYLDYKPIEYQQLWEKCGFLPCLSVLDYIFNCGFNWKYIEDNVSKGNK